MSNLKANLERIEERIQLACDSCGRSRDSVVLIAVSKTVPNDLVAQAYELGLRHFGESRLQEALPKIESMPSDTVWHMVGRLQSNKAKQAAQVFSVLHTLETEAQLREIAKSGKQPDALIELNIAEEQQKSGLLPDLLDSYQELVLRSKVVRLRGLMTVGPAHDDPEEMRPYFRRLARMAESLGPDSWLSMGMSGDFEVAIQEGATHIRVGTALFGERS